MTAVNNACDGMFFIYGYKTLASASCSHGDIVLTATGITTHSKFAIPVPTFENSTCNIHQGSELAELLIVIFGGDFRQILLVIPRGCRSDIINAKVNSSYLWGNIVMLTRNMCLQNGPNNDSETKLKEFSQWLLDLVLTSDERQYLSSESIDKSGVIENEALEELAAEFLNSLRTSSLPNHRIKLKVSTSIMLLRNIDQSKGLCNDTRLIVTRLAYYVIEAKIMARKNTGNLTYIAQTSIHGQLYVAFSRVQSKQGLKIIHDKEGTSLKTTTNVFL
ncbi:hypothetical protein JHK82_031764 [Glycine max]|nr:hypothetical protein JHK87_031701 [Glycine soja]KAG4989438.1 hypothetical protein JHK85_032421 [Glycine max]KAG4995028.1 hypothetical protein JHK86_031855 [Glycine max]KAG5125027.1 hypothetical protein JHK82_031764 [Glycine max]KAG5146452.1 hypothetical protein JHK84_031995 [Glycine max]